MNRMRNVWRRVWVLGMAVGMWLAVNVAIAAKPTRPMPPFKRAAPEAGAGPWVLPYFIVILCVALGLLAVLRVSRRSAQARPN